MSLSRFICYSAVIAGWAAFLAWMLAEVFVYPVPIPISFLHPHHRKGNGRPFRV